jgi:hypothetical protein
MYRVSGYYEYECLHTPHPTGRSRRLWEGLVSSRDRSMDRVAPMMDARGG